MSACNDLDHFALTHVPNQPHRGALKSNRLLPNSSSEAVDPPIEMHEYSASKIVVKVSKYVLVGIHQLYKRDWRCISYRIIHGIKERAIRVFSLEQTD